MTEFVSPTAARVFRGVSRNLVLAAAFAFGAAFFAAVAILTAASVGGAIVAGLVAAGMAYVSVRCALMKAVATPEELCLHGPLRTVVVPWSSIERIVSDDTETDARFLAVRAPVLVLRTGRRIKVRMVSSYDLSPTRHSPDHADHAAAELEAIRVSAPR